MELVESTNVNEYNGFLLKLLEELNEVADKWYDIGLRVEMEPGRLNIIRTNNSQDSEACLREVCLYLIQSGNDKAAILKKVVKALKSKTVSRPDIAQRISGLKKKVEKKACKKGDKKADRNAVNDDEKIPLVEELIKPETTKSNKRMKYLTMVLLTAAVLLLLVGIVLTAMNHSGELHFNKIGVCVVIWIAASVLVVIIVCVCITVSRIA